MTPAQLPLAAPQAQPGLVPGCITEHITRAGLVRYRVRLTVGAERRSLGLFDTLEEAERTLDAATSKVELAALTLATWGERWLAAREVSGLHRAVHKERSAWRSHVARAPFARWPIRRIDTPDVVRWVRELLGVEARRRTGRGAERGLGRRISRQTAVNALGLLRKALSDALLEGYVSRNAAAGVPVPRVPRTTEPWAWLRAVEAQALLASELRPAQRSVFTVAIYAGLRAGELWGLRWGDVRLDGDRPELVVRHSYRAATKAGKVRRVPLLRPAVEALRSWRSAAPGVAHALVWPADGGGCHHEGYDAGLPAALRRAGVRAVRFHDLRHTCASLLISGAWGRAWRLEEVQQMLGHGSRATTERYAHLAPEGLHGAAAATATAATTGDRA